MHASFGPALLAGLATVLSAQGIVPPFRLAQVHPLPSFSPTVLPCSGVRHAHMVHLPGKPPNVLYCTATVTGLSLQYGGTGTYDLLCGDYNVLTDTFTPSTDAAALNTVDDEFHLAVHHSGLYAVFDRGSWITGGIWLTSRSSTSLPWQPPTRVSFSPGGYHLAFYPALADYHGNPHLIHALSNVPQTPWPPKNGIVMAPIDLATATVNGPNILLVAIPYWDGNPVTPVPVLDTQGELIGLSHSILAFNPLRVERCVSLDLDWATPHILLQSTPSLPMTWSGGFLGGRFFDCTSPGIAATDTVWLSGGRCTIGATMSVRLFAPPTAGPQLYLSLVAVGPVFLPVTFPLPPFQGQQGISPIWGWVSDLYAHDNRNGEAVIRFRVPNLAALQGLSIAAQSATIELVSGGLWLGNTASLAVD